ncbi:4-diphosphocytidyl-2-C-methyl-D-erythritol kinase [Catalinimonas alkaloidigena]|uniref:4-diphosphocytidyl-2-C-methyl-D-erythritol kinase n=1 Tax=Catalinimonas alkaloidigena TaxID=1075417 RepID=A0A1G9SG33_9BACT|nr:4-(cytidine 5'-diphospho)-2-C-methyl-D-erythritol kinase [Catalinimonas alkaloidigena]SDM34433.1 4-diphosphocytidyl-2-C-methyl-D-erythritol kinase [Catalinimonas alkaloidigena]
MISFPNAKINLGLHVVRRRPDGFHDLTTGFYPIPWTDALEILPAEALHFSQSGLPIPGDPAQNLCLRAYRLLSDLRSLPPVQMHLHKVVPTGAGLGGGSADATFALKMLNDQFALQLTVEELERCAAQLGSDCAIFVRNQPMLAEGRGELLTPCAVDLKGWYIAVVHPGFAIATPEAFRAIQPAEPERPLSEVLAQPVETWRENLHNDFEAALFPAYPVLATLKNQLYEAGAVYAAMSGSGSAVFGLFRALPDLKQSFSESYTLWQGVL